MPPRILETRANHAGFGEKVALYFLTVDAPFLYCPTIEFQNTMPRQLPWASNGGSRTLVKHSPQAKHGSTTDNDDESFRRTALRSSRKGNGRIIDSDDDVQEPTINPTAHNQEVVRGERAPSSSPPPIAALEEVPPTESMRKGVSKFDLRDDEWMMVEDEFLETAKTFTRHLRIADYEIIKEQMEQKKKQAEIMRPILPGSSLSAGYSIKQRKRAQKKWQKKVPHQVITPQDSEEDGKVRGSVPPACTIASKANSKQMNTKQDADSEDLDITKPPRSHSKSSILPPRRPLPAALPKSKLSSLDQNKDTVETLPEQPIFKEPTPHFHPSITKPRSRLNHTTPFDMLDDYIPPKKRKKITNSSVTTTVTTTVSSTPAKLPLPQPPPSSSPSPTPLNPPTLHANIPSRSEDHASSTPQSRETRDRLAKRSAEREREYGGGSGGENVKTENKNKKKKFDKIEIPTFLF